MRFASDISVFWLIPWAAIAIVLSVWFYSKNSWFNELPKRIRILLKSFRAATLFILGLLLIGLIFESVDYRVEKPIIITLTDRSSSMQNFRDSNLVKGQLDQLREELNNELAEDFELVEMNVGSSADYGTVKDFNDGTSDLAAGFEKINVDFYNRNIGAILFVSDGNFNRGNHPVYAAEKINLTPVFSLAVGDTAQKRDHYIKNVASNEVTFFKNKFPVEVDIEAIKMGKGSATVSISRDGKTLASQKVQYKDGKRDFEHLSFLLDADKIGFNAYTVTVSRESNEYNYQNNSRVFYIEVVDSRSKVVILAGSPHPDVSAFKQVLDEDQNLEVVSELSGKWNKDLNKVDLVIWHEPGVNFDPSIQSLLIEKRIPVLYVVGPNTNAATIAKLNIGLSTGNIKQTDEVQGSINEGFQQFEISDNVKKAIEYFPPLKTRFGEMKLSGGAEIAISQRIGPVKKKEPLLYFNKRGTVKYGVLYGEGIWKWRVNDFVRNGNFDAFNELIQKSGQYLLVKQNTSSLYVTLPKRFTKDEEVIVNASFFNEALEPITKPKINFTLTDEKGKRSNLQFAMSGDMYKLALGKLEPGKYNWTAFTSYNGKKHGKSGVFVVEDIALESIDTYAEHGVMRQVAAKTNGKFELLKNHSNVIKMIREREDITSVSYKEASFNDLIDYKLLFLLLLLFMAGEWFLRRWHGSY
jgi:hypothetical protein